MNAPTLPPPQAAHSLPIREIETPRGVRAWLVEDQTAPLIALRFAFRGGATQDPAGKAGLANMTAGLLDEGAGPYDSAAFHERLDEFAVELSFDADRDALGGSLRTLTRHRDEAFEMLRLALVEPRFDEDAVERIRAQLTAGLKHEAKDPDSIVGRAFAEAAFPGHPYGLAVNGSLETTPGLKRADIAALKGRVIARDNLIIGIVGAISESEAIAALDRIFGELPARASLTATPNVAPAGAGTVIVKTIDIPQTALRFGRPGLGRKDADFIPAMVVNHIFGGGVFQSRLFKEVREKRGLAYSVWSSIVANDHAALLFGGTSTKNERAAESIAVIREQIDDLTRNGPSDEEIEKAKKFITGSYALRFDSSTKIAGQLVHMQLDELGIDWMQRRNGLVWAVTRDDVMRTAGRLFGDGKLLVAAAGQPQGL
ncbi:pitrilysin family protein [Terrarubrum flagellatum]|uniref:M16 family metallopeptidase n=1 Tax=Terrirubrum flagellatum TaxID=2895980 RepID=UPI003144F1B9